MFLPQLLGGRFDSSTVNIAAAFGFFGTNQRNQKGKPKAHVFYSSKPLAMDALTTETVPLLKNRFLNRPANRSEFYI